MTAPHWEEGFRRDVRKRVATLEPRLAPVLAALVQHAYPPEVFALSFEIFPDGLTSSFPVRAFFVDRTNTEFFVYVDGKAEYPSPVDPQLLECDETYPDAWEEAILAEDADADPWEPAVDELIEWFAAVWQRAGGDAFPLDASIAAHDDREEFDLRVRSWRKRNAAF